VCEIDLPQRGQDQPPQRQHREQHEAGGGQDPPGPPRVEVLQRQPPALPQRPQQLLRDQEPRNDEEDIHPDEPAGQVRHASMEDEDGENGHRAQALDVGPSCAGLARSGSGCPCRVTRQQGRRGRSQVILPAGSVVVRCCSPRLRLHMRPLRCAGSHDVTGQH